MRTSRLSTACSRSASSRRSSPGPAACECGFDDITIMNEWQSPHLPDVNRPTSLRTAWLLVGIMVLLIALSACGGDVDPQVLPMDPSPAARAPSDSQDSTPTSASAAPLPALSPRPTVTAPSPSGQSNSPRDPVKAPGFSRMSGLEDRVTLDELLEGQEAMVVFSTEGSSEVFASSNWSSCRARIQSSSGAMSIC